MIGRRKLDEILLGFHLHEPWHLCPPVGKGPVLFLADNCNLCEEERQVKKRYLSHLQRGTKPQEPGRARRKRWRSRPRWSPSHTGFLDWFDGWFVTCIVGSCWSLIVGCCEVVAGAAGGDWEGVVEVGESQGAGDRFR